MKASLKALYQQIRDNHKSLIELSDYLIGEAAKGDLKDLADTAYAMREIAEFADEIRKRANKIGEASQKVGCFIATQTALISGNLKDLEIETEYCKAVAKVKQIVSTPDKTKNPVEYAALMNHYGIPQELFDATTGNPLIVSYWPGIIDRINADLAAGKPLPPGVDPSKLSSEYRLDIRKLKGVGE